MKLTRLWRQVSGAFWANMVLVYNVLESNPAGQLMSSLGRIANGKNNHSGALKIKASFCVTASGCFSHRVAAAQAAGTGAKRRPSVLASAARGQNGCEKFRLCWSKTCDWS
jgi:hypothetical protein